MKITRIALAVIGVSLLAFTGCEKDPSEGTGIHTGPGGDNGNNGGNGGTETTGYTAITPSSTGKWSGTAAEPAVSDGKTIPAFSDDYRSVSGWSYKDQWNLANVHDPSIAYFKGYYYMFNTDASFGNEHLKNPDHMHFPGKRSKDLVNWTYVPGPFSKNEPAWVYTRLNEIRKRMGLEVIGRTSLYDNCGYWAPVIRTVNVNGEERLRMYYCVVVNNTIKSGSLSFDGSWTERAFIGMAETTSPETGEWTDYGFVTCSSSDKGKDGWARASEGDWDAYFYYNAIDPTYIVAGGKHYLIHGSWHSGFALLEVNPQTGMPVKDLGDPWADTVTGLTARFGSRIGARSTSRWQASEAPEIIYKDGYFYLFMAYDGLDIPYNTRVVRSDKIEGPYFDITGRNFTNARGDCYPIVTHPYKFTKGTGWVGISHCAVFQQEGSGDWFYASQGRFPADAGGNAPNAVMMGHVRRIVWCPSAADALDDLWPISLPERYAGLTKTAVKADEITGKWEHINLKYDYGKQDTAANLELKADGTMSGTLSGTWSFDEAKQYLTLTAGGKSVVVVVAHEVDWEATPRAETVVYAGTEKTLNATWWGKKVN
jgi:arabinan endo-1,5-alpha-L-arabinosidase